MPSHHFIILGHCKNANREITRRYPMTMVGLLLFFVTLQELSLNFSAPPELFFFFFFMLAESSSSSQSSLHLYHLALHTGHLSRSSYSFQYRMQWFRHACIDTTSNDNGDISFFASLVLLGNSFPFGSILCMRPISFVKLLSNHALLAFNFRSSRTNC